MRMLANAFEATIIAELAAIAAVALLCWAPLNFAVPVAGVFGLAVGFAAFVRAVERG